MTGGAYSGLYTDPNDPRRLIPGMSEPTALAPDPNDHMYHNIIGASGPYQPAATAVGVQPGTVVPPVTPTAANGAPGPGGGAVAPVILAPAAVDLYNHQLDFGAGQQRENTDAFGVRFNPLSGQYEQTVPDRIRQAAVTGYYNDEPTMAREQLSTQLIGALGKAPGDYTMNVGGLGQADRAALDEYHTSLGYGPSVVYDQHSVRPGTAEDAARRYWRARIQTDANLNTAYGPREPGVPAPAPAPVSAPAPAADPLAGAQTAYDTMYSPQATGPAAGNRPQAATLVNPPQPSPTAGDAMNVAMRMNRRSYAPPAEAPIGGTPWGVRARNLLTSAAGYAV